MKQAFSILTVITILAIASCNRGKDVGEKAERIAKKAKNKIEETTKEIADNIIPIFNASEPDTKFNKRRFREFIQVDLTPDVKNIYCYGDALGINSKYQFSFNCNTSTARRIISKHNLRPDTVNSGFSFGIQHEFDWWDKKKIEKLNGYSWQVGHRYFRHFWYDTTEQKAYYLDFDL